MKTLDQIACEQGTDRASNGWHSYCVTYDELFSPLRDQPITILEMGVLGGAGIRMWNEYFIHPETKIIGIDIQNYGGAIPDSPRVSIRMGSQSDPAFVGRLPGNFDIVIDDAGHFASQQITAFGLLWQRVVPGGFYAIEDLHTAWSPQHCDSAITIMQFLEKIMEEMQDHAGAEGRAKPNLGDRWHSIDQIIYRKGLAVFRKR